MSQSRLILADRMRPKYANGSKHENNKKLAAKMKTNQNNSATMSPRMPNIIFPNNLPATSFFSISSPNRYQVFQITLIYVLGSNKIPVTRCTCVYQTMINYAPNSCYVSIVGKMSISKTLYAIAEDFDRLMKRLGQLSPWLWHKGTNNACTTYA